MSVSSDHIARSIVIGRNDWTREGNGPWHRSPLTIGRSPGMRMIAQGHFMTQRYSGSALQWAFTRPKGVSEMARDASGSCAGAVGASLSLRPYGVE